MKKRIITILIIIVCLSTVGLIMFFTKNMKVSQKIINSYNKKEETTFELKLSDYTNFEWDTVVIYNNPTSKQELFEVSGIDYKKELDLQSGMIFVKDNDIVYEEYFKTDFESPYKLIIYPYQDINAESKINKFSKEDAIFTGKKIKYNSENRYVFRPINFNSQLSYTREQLAEMTLEYFFKTAPEWTLAENVSKEEYHVGIGENVIDEYVNQDMVVIEIRHINNNINNTLDARYYINIFTAKGFDDYKNEIDLN